MSPVHGIIGHVSWPRFQSIRSWQLWLAACWRSVCVVQPRFFSHFREVQQYFSELGLPKGMLEIPPGITQARLVAQGGLCASILEIVRDTISITIHNLIKEMYDWSGWHVGTGSRMLSCTAEARVEGRRHSHHPLHHQQGDGRVRAVLGRFTLPSTTFHRHPHCTCVTQHAPNTGTSTYARKSWGGLPRCDLAPQSTSFGTVALRERQHLAMAGSEHLHLPRNATAHRAARANSHSVTVDMRCLWRTT